MKLTDFIRSYMDDIVSAWEREAEAILPHRELSRDELRDHVEQILLEVVAELESAKSDEDQVAWYDDGGPPDDHSPAYQHGAERFSLGVDIVHVATEFRALRLTVLRLWSQHFEPTQAVDLDDLIRFNAEIDKAVRYSTERYANEKQKQGRLFETMLSSLPDPCFILSLEGKFLYANQAMADLCELPVARITGRSFSEMPLPRSYKDRAHLEKVVNYKRELQGEVGIETPAGSSRFFEYVYAPVLDKKGQVEAISGIAHDITARREYEAEIWRHANYDITTDIPNRRLFLDRLNQHAGHSARTGDPFALLFIDLDHFKEVNDRFGHDAGDELLERIAERITGCVRHADTVARIGGDEFTVLLLDTGSPDIINDIASNILAELARPVQLGQDSVVVSCSIGITLFPQDASTAQDLLNNADQAMYFAKHSGRNQVCMFAEIKDQRHSLRQSLIRDLRETDQSQHLRLHYQPIVDLSDGHIAKAEALLRWQHPDRGFLLPKDFLPLAEETGLMSILEQWVFTEAVSHLEQWLSLSETSFQLTINASPVQFMNSKHEKPWTRHMERISSHQGGIAIELTENVFLHESEDMNKRFAELKDAGVQLVLDDFGTGYSSMAYLKRFDINYLKIDRSFIRYHDTQPTCRTIAETIILMAHKLGLKVVAEGVETLEQRDWLREVGCDYAQGYFFAQPLAPEDFGRMLKAGHHFH